VTDIERRQFLRDVRAVLDSVVREPGNRSLARVGVNADWHGQYVRMWFGNREWHEDLPCRSIWCRLDDAGRRSAVLGACADGYENIVALRDDRREDG
jgi:hypothetical protein